MQPASLVKRTRYSLWLGSALVILLIGSVAYTSIDSKNKLESVIHNAKVSTLMHRVESDLHQLREHELGFFVEIGDPAARSREQGTWARTHDDLDKTLGELRTARKDANEAPSPLIDDIAVFSRDYGKAFERISSEALSQPALSAEAIAAYENRMTPLQERASTLLDAISQEQIAREAADEKRERQIEREMMAIMMLTLALGGLAILILIALSLFVPARLTAALTSLTQTIDEVSLGKRHNPVGSSGISDFDSIEQAIERLRISVNGMLQRLVPSR